MPMTMTEKILAAHAGRDRVSPGDLVEVSVDLALANDITAPLAIRVFASWGLSGSSIPRQDRPGPGPFRAQQGYCLGTTDEDHDGFRPSPRHPPLLRTGRPGIEHVLLPEKGLIVPGDLVIGADSHTCTYGALGAFSAGVGSTDLGVIMATGRIWLKVPATIKVVLKGRLRPWVGGKDLILHTIGRSGRGGGRLQGTGIHGGDRLGPFHGPAVHHGQHGRGGRCQKRHLSAGRRDTRVYLAADGAGGHLPAERRGCPLRIHPGGGRRDVGAPGGLSPFAGQCETRFGRWRHSPRSGLHRFVHQRSIGRPPAGARRSSRDGSGQGDTPHRHTRDARSITRRPCGKGSWKRSWTQGRSSGRPAAAPAWAATWGSWLGVKGRFPPPTGILSAEWDTPKRGLSGRSRRGGCLCGPGKDCIPE